MPRDRANSNGSGCGVGSSSRHSSMTASSSSSVSTNGYSTSSSRMNNNNDFRAYQNAMERQEATTNVVTCCVPTGCDYCDVNINVDNLPEDVVRVVCNNEQCPVGQYMHRDCFESWELTVLAYLRSTGRARSWSEKQRLQNLWTKKGYDLAFKACSCKCGKGHLRKDLDWVPLPCKSNGYSGGGCCNGLDDRRKRNRKKNRNVERPSLGSGGCSGSGGGGGNGLMVMMSSSSPRDVRPSMLRLRSNSMSSTGSNSGSSPPSSGGEPPPMSPSHHHVVLLRHRRPSTRLEFFAEKAESASAGGIFSRRLDYSSFNLLPRHKINSYHIKMEDEGNCGNDETRCFVLSTLAAAHVCRVACVLCQSLMLIFDQYPLIDGTFFLSPRQYSKSCFQVKFDNRPQYLGAVCMSCLESWNTVLRCRYCLRQWQGTSLILGTMYSYDIFAANPCCLDRLRCSKCLKLVLLPEQRCSYFSDYSNSLPCPHCGHVDHHFVKGLSTFYRGTE